MKEVKRKSNIPFYGATAVLLLYALFFPLNVLPDYCILLGSAIITFVVLSIVFRGKTAKNEQPATTGNEDADNLLREGEKAVKELTRIRGAISETEIQHKIDALIDITDKIFKDVLEDESDYRQIRRFADFYLPTTMKLLHAYERFGSAGVTGEHIDSTLERIDAALDKIIDSYNRQYDALFKNQALDIETDITVLEQMLKKEGLTGPDFI